VITLPAAEGVLDASGIAPRAEALLPSGARRRQLTVRTLLLGMMLALADGPAGPEPQLPDQRRVQRQLGLQPVSFGGPARARPAVAAQVPGEHPALAVVTHGPAV